ncbi:hypothetical protein BH11PSE13_BH11PSE13_12390 [soil metagenome]
MHFAQLLTEHNAHRTVMQTAYAASMEIPNKESPRRARRRHWLGVLIDECGGAAQVAREIGTPKSHLSAMRSGARGLGDDLAARLEETYAKEAGWFDRPVSGNPVLPPTDLIPAYRTGRTPSVRDLVMQLRDLMLPHRAAVRQSAWTLLSEVAHNPEDVDTAEQAATDLARLIGPSGNGEQRASSTSPPSKRAGGSKT